MYKVPSPLPTPLGNMTSLEAAYFVGRPGSYHRRRAAVVAHLSEQQRSLLPFAEVNMFSDVSVTRRSSTCKN